MDMCSAKRLYISEGRTLVDTKRAFTRNAITSPDLFLLLPLGVDKVYLKTALLINDVATQETSQPSEAIELMNVTVTIATA